jgi:hypothetical protein
VGCDTCNTLKGTRIQPPAARVAGYRFFRPDKDYFGDHFATQEDSLRSLSNTGYYSIHGLNLNRQYLRTIRQFRSRLSTCNEHIAGGILALKKFSIDRLPLHLRSPASRGVKALTDAHQLVVVKIDEVLRENAKSVLLDPDPTAPQQKIESEAKLKAVAAMYPGDWRAPKKARQTK